MAYSLPVKLKLPSNASEPYITLMPQLAVVLTVALPATFRSMCSE